MSRRFRIGLALLFEAQSTTRIEDLRQRVQQMRVRVDALCMDPSDREAVFDVLHELSKLEAETVDLEISGLVDELVDKSEECSDSFDLEPSHDSDPPGFERPKDLEIMHLVPFEYVDWQPMPKNLDEFPVPFEMHYKEDINSWEIFVLFRRQLESDTTNVLSTPNLLYDSEILPNGARIQLSHNAIALQADCTVYPVKRLKRAARRALHSSHQLVIKYQSNCRTLGDSIMDLERDYWFLKAVESTGISPKALFLSPPVKLPEYMSPKTSFRMSEVEYLVCALDERSYVRYMIMERVARDVWWFVQHPTSLRYRFKTSIRMVINLLPKIERMHKKGIIHGDIHPGNIVELVLDSNEFGLIDYGRAAYVSEYKYQYSQYIHRDSHCYLTPFHLSGSMPAYRDDVYMTLLTAGFIMYPEIHSFCNRLASDPAWRDSLYRFHRTSFLFDPPGHTDGVRRAFPSLSEGMRIAVRKLLKESVDLVRWVYDPTDRPDYRSIVRNMKAILGIVGPLED